MTTPSQVNRQGTTVLRQEHILVESRNAPKRIGGRTICKDCAGTQTTEEHQWPQGCLRQEG